MSSWFKSLSKASPKETETKRDNSAVQALPASWYRSPAMFELERRAIFSKKWILVSHQQRLPNVGDYVRITEAGFPLFLIKDKQGLIKAHHNVCRHRAYPVVEQESGKASILACKYHGRLTTNLECHQFTHFAVRLVLRVGRKASEGTKVPRYCRI